MSPWSRTSCTTRNASEAVSVADGATRSACAVFRKLLAQGYASHTSSGTRCTTNASEVSKGNMSGTTACRTGKERSAKYQTLHFWSETFIMFGKFDAFRVFAKVSRYRELSRHPPAPTLKGTETTRENAKIPMVRLLRSGDVCAKSYKLRKLV